MFLLALTVALEVEYNNTIVYSGTLPATTRDPLPTIQPDSQADWATELFSFDTDTDTTGQIPMTITVTDGVIFFGHLWMNYTGNATYQPDPANPGQYIVTPVAPVDYFDDPNTNTVETDGITNTTKNGVAWEWRTNVGDNLGDWAYPVSNGETFAFEFFVDPAKVVLDPYVPPTPPAP